MSQSNEQPSREDFNRKQTLFRLFRRARLPQRIQHCRCI